MAQRLAPARTTTHCVASPTPPECDKSACKACSSVCRSIESNCCTVGSKAVPITMPWQFNPSARRHSRPAGQYRPHKTSPAMTRENGDALDLAVFHSPRRPLASYSAMSRSYLALISGLPCGPSRWSLLAEVTMARPDCSCRQIGRDSVVLSLSSAGHPKRTRKTEDPVLLKCLGLRCRQWAGASKITVGLDLRSNGRYRARTCDLQRVMLAR